MRHFTSDLHLFDDRHVLPYRDFSTMNDMLDEIARNWNDEVAPEDEVWLLGDAAYANVPAALEWLDDLNGFKVLVCGNHDLPWTGRSLASRPDARRWEKRYLKAFREVMHGIVPIELRDSSGDWAIDALASHFPRRGARRHGTEFDPWLVGCEGTWLLHGHTHSHRQMDVHEMTFHVGVDANAFTPVSEDRVVALILEAEDEFGYDMEANRA